MLYEQILPNYGQGVNNPLIQIFTLKTHYLQLEQSTYNTTLDFIQLS